MKKLPLPAGDTHGDSQSLPGPDTNVVEETNLNTTAPVSLPVFVLVPPTVTGAEAEALTIAAPEAAGAEITATHGKDLEPG